MVVIVLGISVLGLLRSEGHFAPVLGAPRLVSFEFWFALFLPPIPDSSQK